MELQQIKGFLAVARCGSFSKAAGKTFRTQPAISLQVSSLEKELGVKLFDRLGARKVLLTEQGKALFDIASPLIDDMETLPSRFKEAIGKSSCIPVRIATHNSVMVHLLPPIVMEFKRKFKDCEMSIVNRGRPEIIDMVSSGEVDIGISSLTRVPRNLDYQVAARFKRILITPRNHPLSGKRSVSLKDLVSFPLLVPPRGTNTRTKIDEAFASAGLAYKIAMEITGREAAKVYVGMGFGISVINEYYLTETDKKMFSIKDMSGHFGESERGVITRKNRSLSLPASELVQIILKRVKSGVILRGQ